MRRRRTLWGILIAVPLILLSADTLYWWFAIGRLEQGFAAWEAERRAAGWADRHGPPARGGWPLAATLTVPAMSLSGGSPNIPGRLTWSADWLVLRVALPRPGLLAVSAEGGQRVGVAGNAEVRFTASRLRLELPLGEEWPGFGDVLAQDVRADTPAGNASVQSLRLHLDFRPDAKPDEPPLEFSLKAVSIVLPPGMVRPLGPRIASLETDGALNGPLPPGGRLADQAAAWRDGGGSLEIHQLALTWGPLDLTASATLALDDELQPMGAGNARMVGYAETLDALAAHAAISRSAATATKAVLSLMAHNPEDGSPPDVEVPLTLQYRTLSMRQVPLVRLPEVDWP